MTIGRAVSSSALQKAPPGRRTGPRRGCPPDRGKNETEPTVAQRQARQRTQTCLIGSAPSRLTGSSLCREGGKRAAWPRRIKGPRKPAHGEPRDGAVLVPCLPGWRSRRRQTRPRRRSDSRPPVRAGSSQRLMAGIGRTGGRPTGASTRSCLPFLAPPPGKAGHEDGPVSRGSRWRWCRRTDLIPNGPAARFGRTTRHKESQSAWKTPKTIKQVRWQLSRTEDFFPIVIVPRATFVLPR